MLMRGHPRELLDATVWPDGGWLQPFTTEHAASVYDLPATARIDGGGSVEVFPAWWSSMESDADLIGHWLLWHGTPSCGSSAWPSYDAIHIAVTHHIYN